MPNNLKLLKSYYYFHHYLLNDEIEASKIAE